MCGKERSYWRVFLDVWQGKDLEKVTREDCGFSRGPQGLCSREGSAAAFGDGADDAEIARSCFVCRELRQTCQITLSTILSSKLSNEIAESE